MDKMHNCSFDNCCHYDKKMVVTVENDHSNWSLIVRKNVGEERYSYAFFPITYCPFCGEKLEK